MHIGYLSTIYHTSFILKNSSSPYLKNYPLNWSLFATGPAMIESFASNEIDVGYIGLPPVMIGIENGLPLKCVGGGHVEGTVIIAPNSYRSFDKLGSIRKVLNQFEGKTVGTPSKGSIHDVIMRNMARGRDIKIKNFRWADFIIESMEEGVVDAGVGTPSLATAAANRLNSHVVIPSNHIWPYNPSYGIVVREELIHENREFIKDFLKAHEDACNLIRTQPKTAANIVLKEIEVLNQDFILDTYKISPKYCASLPKRYINSTLKFIPVLKKLGYLKDSLNERDIFAVDFIRKIHTEDPHYDLGSADGL